MLDIGFWIGIIYLIGTGATTGAYLIYIRIYLGCCKLENEILKEAKNLVK